MDERWQKIARQSIRKKGDLGEKLKEYKGLWRSTGNMKTNLDRMPFLKQKSFWYSTNYVHI